MSGFRIVLLAAVLATMSAVAIAQAPMRIRGTITSLEGNVLNVKSREGKDLKISLPDNLVVVAAKAITFDDIKPGDFVGPASKTRPDGKLVAISLQLFPAALRGVVPEGTMPWDLEPGSVMTNANVAAVISGAGRARAQARIQGRVADHPGARRHADVYHGAGRAFTADARRLYRHHGPRRDRRGDVHAADRGEQGRREAGELTADSRPAVRVRRASSGSAPPPSDGCAPRAAARCTAPSRTSRRECSAPPRRRRRRGSRRRGSPWYSASTAIFMKPCVSPFSSARPTRVIGRMPISARRPDLRISASVIPARPSGGSMNSAVRRAAVADPAAARHSTNCRRRFRNRCRTCG